MSSNTVKNKHVIIQQEKLFFPELQRRYVEGAFELKRLGVGTAGVVYQVSPTHVIKVMRSERYLKHIGWYKETLGNLQKLAQNSREWVNPRVGSFDSFGGAMLLLYIMSTGDSWYGTAPTDTMRSDPRACRAQRTARATACCAAAAGTTPCT